MLQCRAIHYISWCQAMDTRIWDDFILYRIYYPNSLLSYPAICWNVVDRTQIDMSWSGFAILVYLLRVGV